MKKRQVVVGEYVPGTRLRVLAQAPSDSHGNQRVQVRCEWIVNGNVCGATKQMRVTAMTSTAYLDKNGKLRVPHKSCGCQSKRAYRDYWESRAKGIRRMVQQKIYRDHKTYGRSFNHLAKEYKMPVQLVTTIFRLYSERLKRRSR